MAKRTTKRKVPHPRVVSEQPEDITEREIEDIEERSSPRTPVIYEIVRRYGEEELARPVVSLWWSGLAAGLSISFSLLSQALLQMHLPDVIWRPLISSLGYSVGFLMVVLARQQLFTENTISAVLPFMAEPTFSKLGLVARMWAVVFLANITGTMIAAAFCTFTPVLPEDLRQSMIEISRHGVVGDWLTLGFKGITAGFLIAAMVWLKPSADTAQFSVVTLLTYLIALGNFSHIVAGSVESFMLVMNGQLGLGMMLIGFTLPVLIGNIIGGTVLFAVLSYAQVMKEMPRT